jgi:signal peptidase I
MTEPASLRRGDIDVAAQRASKGGRWPIALAIVAGLILLFGRLFFFQPFSIPSGSMVPTLVIGDYVIVAKYPYGFSHFSLPAFLDWAPGSMPGRLFASQPRRGDVIVFKLPRDSETDYIKRLIGLPGDKIQMIKGRLYINGAIVERTPLPPYSIADGGPTNVAHYQETLPGGVKHEIIEVSGDDGEYDNTGVYTVPPGNYFMVGDNRDNSLDSRMPAERAGVGFVPFENLIGRAEVILFSAKEGEPVWNRLFQPVR